MTNMTLAEAWNSPQCKAWDACRMVKPDITDNDVIELYEYCEFYESRPKGFATFMFNVHGVVDIQPFNEWCSLFVKFYNMMHNHVIRQLALRDLTIYEIPDYRYGLGRNLLCLAACIDRDVINTTQMRSILDDLLEPINIGVEFEDYILHSDKFDVIDNSVLLTAIDIILLQQQKIVDEFKSGKEKVIGSLIGMVMKQVKADPIVVKEMLLSKLKN